MADLNRALKEVLLTPRQLAAERERHKQEASARHAQAETAERMREIDEFFETRRRQLQQEAQSRRSIGAWRPWHVPANEFGNAAKAVTAPELPGWLREFFEIEAGPNNLLDPCNPDRVFVLGASYGAVFDAGFSSNGPSLDL